MNQLLTDSFTRVPIIGILRGYSRDETNGILDAYGSAGLSAIEITLNSQVRRKAEDRSRNGLFLKRSRKCSGCRGGVYRYTYPRYFRNSALQRGWGAGVPGCLYAHRDFPGLGGRGQYG